MGFREWWAQRRQEGRQYRAAYSVREFVYWNPDAVEFDATGVRFVDARTCPPHVSRVGWCQITKILAYKRDCSTVDQVCVHIYAGDESHYFDDDFHGWEELVLALSKYLSGAMPWDDFWNKVVQPPFATNFTVIYEKPSPS